MATYTSTQTGNWNTNATWGGSGHPSADGDVVNIGHHVDYDAGDSAVAYGNVTITSGGVLHFPEGSTSRLLFGATAILTVNSGGEFRCGTSGSPITSPNKVRINWPLGSTVRDVFEVPDGSIVNVYGDPAYYGSDMDTTLQADYTHPGSGTSTLYVVGDFSAKWLAGQNILVARNATSIVSNPNYTEVRRLVINSVSSYDAGNDRTPIVVEYNSTVSGVAFLNGAVVLNISRNIEIGNDSTSLDAQTTTSGNYIRINQRQAIGNDNCHWENCMFRGTDRFHDDDASTTCFNIKMKQVVFASCHYGIRAYEFGVLEQMIWWNCGSSCSSGSRRIKISGYIMGCAAGFAGREISIISGQFLHFEGVSTISNTLSNSVLDPVVVNQAYYGPGNSSDVVIRGTFSRLNRVFNDMNSNVIVDGTFSNVGRCISATENHKVVIRGTMGALLDTFMSLPSLAQSELVLENVVYDGVERPYRGYAASGNILPLVSTDSGWQAPPSGNSWILRMTPNSYVDVYRRRLKYMLYADSADYITSAASHTITFKIYPVDWTETLDQDDIYIEAYYHDGTGGTRTKAVTGAGTFANSGWRNLTATFTTGKAGIVYFNIYLTRYESASHYVLIDPVWSVS